MLYIVTGLMRTGTSLMMQLLREAGIPPHYSREHELLSLKGRLRNKAFLEAKECLRGDISGVPDGACVKVFINRIDRIELDESRHKVIAMWRSREDRFRSMRHRMSSREWLQYQQKNTHANAEVEQCYQHLLVRFPSYLLVKFNDLFEHTYYALDRLAEYTGVSALRECASVIEHERRHFREGD